MRGEMRVMGCGGDERVPWDTDVQETVDTAKAKFADLLLAGYQGFATLPETRKLDEFDPMAERVVMVMPMQGG